MDPFDLSKDWGRSDDDQRHRLAVNGAVELPSPVQAERRASGVLLRCPSTSLRASRRFKGTAARPIVNGEFIPRNAGVGSDFFSINARISRIIRVNRRRQSTHPWKPST